MIVRIVLVSVLLVSILALSRADTRGSAQDSELLTLLPESDSLFTYTLSDSLAFESQLSYPGTPNGGEVRIGEVYGKGHFLGWIVQRWAMGRYEPFRFAVAIDTTLSVAALKVLEYRSMYGGEIQDDSFLRQFHGLSDTDQIAIGKGIDAVSGASFSAPSITDETRYTLMAIQWLHSIGALDRR